MTRPFVLSTAAVLFAASSAFAGTMYTVDSNRTLYTLDLATGARTPAGVISANAGTTSGLAHDPATGTVWVVSTSTDSLYTVDLATGTATLVGAFGDSAIVMHGLEFDDSTGKLYGASSHNGGLYEINKATGAATLIGVSGLVSFTNLGYDSANDVMYACNTTTPESFHIMNRATGATTFVGLLGAVSSNPNGMAFNRDNGLLYLIDNTTDNLYTIDVTTGAATVIGPMGSGNYLGLVYIPDPAPPACYANCDGSTTPPVLNVQDFSCFLNAFASGESYANCDGSTTEPVLNVQDFSCFLNAFAAGCT
jgi:DNA-binding beta-propeller fold protein YncE